MAADSSNLDDQVRRADPDRWLSSRFIADPQARADVVALYAFDHELARAPRVASNSLLGEIRLTWWREVLDEIFEARPVRHHPTAQALATLVNRHGLDRAELELMIDSRYRELDPAPMDVAEALAWARETGGVAARLATQVLDAGAAADLAVQAGAAWALARRVPDQPELREPFERLLSQARLDARRLSVRAFPAIAHAAFAAGRATGRQSSEFARRIRLMSAVARGRV